MSQQETDEEIIARLAMDTINPVIPVRSDVEHSQTEGNTAMQIMNAQDARTKWRDLVNNAEVKGEATVITRYRTVAAVLVPSEWYEKAAELLGAPGEDQTGTS